MPHEVVCPHCGGFVPLDTPRSGGEPTASLASLEVAHTIEMLIPGTLCGDDHPAADGAGVMMATPDRAHQAEVVLARHDPDGSRSSSGSSEFDPLSLAVADPILDAFVAEEPTASLVTRPFPSNGSADGAAIPALDLAPPSASRGAEAEDEPGPDGGPSWLLVLLASYASAATLGLFWLLWAGHGRPTPRDMLSPRPRAEPAARAAMTPLSEDRLTRLGETLAVGSLEFTPLEVRAGDVPLEGGGAGALILRARFKNVSADETFAPLEKALIRVLDSGGSETRIETAGEPIEAYPLAEASERSLRGQSFAPLKPGEAMETVVVSDRDATSRLSEVMTWRVRLRVDPRQASTVGVTFRKGDVR